MKKAKKSSKFLSGAFGVFYQLDIEAQFFKAS
jgi:hypothetical protein